MARELQGAPTAAASAPSCGSAVQCTPPPPPPGALLQRQPGGRYAPSTSAAARASSALALSLAARNRPGEPLAVLAALSSNITAEITVGGVCGRYIDRQELRWWWVRFS